MQPSRIDHARIRSIAPFRAILTADCGPAQSNRFRHAFHDDRDAALEFYPTTNTYCCFSCGSRGDIFDYLKEAHGMTAEEVAAYVDPSASGATLKPRLASAPRMAPERRHAHLDDAWQSEVAEFIGSSRDCLWLPEGRPSLDYLHGRGLSDETLRFFGVGFNPRWKNLGPFEVLSDKSSGPELNIAPGIVIPLIARNSWFDDLDRPRGPKYQGAVIRRQAANPNDPLPLQSNGKPGQRYGSVKGTERHELYPFPTIDPSEFPTPIIWVEGEFDAMTVWQEARHLGIPATLGGAKSRPSDFALGQIARCTHLLVATDNFDARGQEAYDFWKERFPSKTRRRLFPHGKDANDFHRNGGNLADWIAATFRRCGIPPKPGDAFEGDLPDALPRLV